jgi:hypothetical protein
MVTRETARWKSPSGRAGMNRGLPPDIHPLNHGRGRHEN